MELIQRHFPNLPLEYLEKLRLLPELYGDWNSKINVISRKDIDQLETRHVLHSLSIYKLIQFPSGSKILDVGTGGGFPGIPLAIVHPDSSFHLVDSILKKIKVVQAVADGIQLSNVKAEQKRAEKLIGIYDFITARAVTKLKPFFQWVHKALAPQGEVWLLKGGDLDEEILEFQNAFPDFSVEQFSLQALFPEIEFFETKKVLRVYKD
jgi:16S rRNA (guanine527-N7)-methyltransferase